QVRSLTLDRWTPTLVGLLERVGNNRANSVWEADRSISEKYVIGPEADRASREAFIRSKYQHGAFLSPPLDKSPEAVERASRRLFDACKAGDMDDVIWCLAHGADVNWAN
ncbi:unnamed protein product, partial [Choristocarpus tenellus]